MAGYELMHELSRTTARNVWISPCVVGFFIILLSPSGVWAQSDQSVISTSVDRAALVDYLIEKTIEREAFSKIKNDRMGFDPIEDMKQIRPEIVNAKTSSELYYGLLKLSNARRDTHLSIEDVGGGPSPDMAIQEMVRRNKYAPGAQTTQIKFAVDFSRINAPRLFVSDFGTVAGGANGEIMPGDWVVKINGRSVRELESWLMPSFRFSTMENYWARMSAELSQLTKRLPPEFFRNQLELKLQRKSGETYEVKLPYVSRDSITWNSKTEEKYLGFEKHSSDESFDVFLSRDRRLKVVLLDWHGFRKDLSRTTNKLIEFAEKNRLFDHDLIIDLTRSRGGSRGAYAIRRLTPKPFKTTFGNLRLSDAAGAFIKRKRRESSGKNLSGSSRWLLDWLNGDVTKRMAQRKKYSSNVPFKCAHLPSHSDGIIKPAKQHFRGRMICWFSPYGGSHLDQFSAIVSDNNLAYTMGMPTGGYSNTWEHEEEVKFPISGKPVIKFMWSIGHTIRPNGEVLEGNPADVDEYVPITRDNFHAYRNMLLEKSLKRIRN